MTPSPAIAAATIAICTGVTCGQALAEGRARQLDVVAERPAVAVDGRGDVAGRHAERPAGWPDRHRVAEAEAAGVVEELLGTELEADVREEDVARDLERLGQRPQVRLDAAEVVLADREAVDDEAVDLLGAAGRERSSTA